MKGLDCHGDGMGWVGLGIEGGRGSLRIVRARLHVRYISYLLGGTYMPYAVWEVTRGDGVGWMD